MNHDKAFWDARTRWERAIRYAGGWYGIGPVASVAAFDEAPAPWRRDDEPRFSAVKPDTSQTNGDRVAAFDAEIARIHAWVEEQKIETHREDKRIIRQWAREGLSNNAIVERLHCSRSAALALIKEAMGESD